MFQHQYYSRRAASTKTRIETRGVVRLYRGYRVAGRHPLKQGLKLTDIIATSATTGSRRAASTKTRIETDTPYYRQSSTHLQCRRAASTKTRIETPKQNTQPICQPVAGRHPLKQGLKPIVLFRQPKHNYSRRAASTKTRIETIEYV